MSGPGLRRYAWLAAVLLLMTVPSTVAFAPSRASAAPASRPTIEQVRRQVDQLSHQAEVASERYNDLREQIASLDVRLAAARSRLAEQRTAVAGARQRLGRIAADTYKAGDLATLALFLGDHPDGYVAANGLLVSLGDRKAQVMDEVLQQQRELVAALTDVEEQQQRLGKARQDLRATRTDVERKLSAQTELLARLTADERGRLGRLQSGQERTSLEDLGIRLPASGRLSCDDVPVVAPSSRVARVLAYACAQLGDPYRWAGSGPATFDCSGLTMMAWNEAGVSLPHSSQLQARQGTKVSIDDLQAGDLVFFHSSFSHVGIYIGKGLMLHAPQTGDVVKIAPMRYNGSFVDAVRL